MRPFSVELVERALAALEGWGGPEVLRRDRAARARHLDDPYLIWAVPHAEGVILLALEEGWKGLPEEARPDYLRLYRQAVEAGIAIPEGAKAAVRRFRQEVR